MQPHSITPKTIEQTCQHCGKMFLCYRSKVAKGGGKYCSVDCFLSTNKGPSHSCWKGGRSIDKQGYARLYILTGKGWCRIREHRVAMERLLGRPLKHNEQVHHINGNKLDNSPENLELTTGSNHRKLHAILRRNGQWTKDYKCCLICHTAERKHNAHGLCTICYSRKTRHDRLS